MLKTARSMDPPPQSELKFSSNWIFQWCHFVCHPGWTDTGYKGALLLKIPHCGCGIWRALYRDPSFRRLDSKWPNSVSWSLLSAICKAFSFPFLHLSCSITLRSIPHPTPHPLPLLEVVKMGPSTLYIPARLYHHTPAPHAFLIKNIWAPISSPGTVPGPVGPTVKNKQNFAFLPKASILVRQRE